MCFCAVHTSCQAKKKHRCNDVSMLLQRLRRLSNTEVRLLWWTRHSWCDGQASLHDYSHSSGFSIVVRSWRDSPLGGWLICWYISSIVACWLQPSLDDPYDRLANLSDIYLWIRAGSAFHSISFHHHNMNSISEDVRAKTPQARLDKGDLEVETRKLKFSLRRWTNITATSGESIMFAGTSYVEFIITILKPIHSYHVHYWLFWRLLSWENY